LIENLNFEHFPNMNVFRSEQPFFLKILKFLKLKIKKEKKRRGSVTWASPGTPPISPFLVAAAHSRRPPRLTETRCRLDGLLLHLPVESSPGG
jgi:hypothetical protein